ncbi:MAG: hypothetical protein IH991_20150 [Planctomycetes bacterium]|nr:hypothetical protein [Planctomycetota bacterium]
MSKRKRQVDRTLLESWRPPRGAGDPIGCLTTTFTFGAGLFEEECLARFLEIDSLPDREGLAYLLERENRLGPTYAGVLVDHRQSGVDHSLRWDVLPVRIPQGKQHAKISLLAWTNHVRIIVASANLTPHGYRFNHEVAGTIELTPKSSSHSLFEESSTFFGSLLRFVPGPPDDRSIRRANEFLEQVGRHVAAWQNTTGRGERLRQHLAFTLPATSDGDAPQSSLRSCLAVCRRHGKAPTEIWAASPFFDPAPPKKDDQVTVELCKSMGRSTKRRLTLCVPALHDNENTVRLAAPKSLVTTAKRFVDRLNVACLPKIDSEKNTRPWHAKMLACSTPQYNALMIGSSNYTKGGMGIGGVFNAEANLIYVARRDSFAREAGALDECWPEVADVDDPDAVEWAGPQQETVEEEQVAAAPPLPTGFVAASYRAGEAAAILLTFQPDKLPDSWQVLAGRNHDEQLLDSLQHAAQGNSVSAKVTWEHDYAPGKLLVKWGDKQAFWSLNVEDQAKLPVPREIESMTAQDLLFILAASDASGAFRAWARRKATDSGFDEELDSAVPGDLDPLRRYNLQDTFLRRVRRQARLLAGVRQNLERPVWSEQALQWRLSGMIGVERLADRVAQGLTGENGEVSEAVLNLADLLMMLSEVVYRESETALSRLKFNRHYKRFLKQLTKELDHRISDVKHDIPRDVREFWSNVRTRFNA